MLNDLMEELGELWNASGDARYKGEHPGCDRLQEAIEVELKKMGVDEMQKFLDGLSSGQMEQLRFVLEEMVEEYPFVEDYIGS